MGTWLQRIGKSSRPSARIRGLNATSRRCEGRACDCCLARAMLHHDRQRRRALRQESEWQGSSRHRTAAKIVKLAGSAHARAPNSSTGDGRTLLKHAARADRVRRGHRRSILRDPVAVCGDNRELTLSLTHAHFQRPILLAGGGRACVVVSRALPTRSGLASARPM